MPNTPIDYQSALDAFRKEEHVPDNPVHTSSPRPNMTNPWES